MAEMKTMAHQLKALGYVPLQSNSSTFKTVRYFTRPKISDENQFQCDKRHHQKTKL